MALARADSLTARATQRVAHEFPNPVANVTVTRDEPHWAWLLTQPFDYPWVRGARVHAADAGYRAAAYRFAFERGTAQLEVDTMYTRAVAALGHARVSRQNAIDADSLRRLAVIRRDAGDASDMDVALATVNAGQEVNLAASDSLAAVGAVLDLQDVMGLPSDHLVITPSDSLGVPDTTSLTSGAMEPSPGVTQGDGAPRRPATPLTSVAAVPPSGSGTPLQIAAAEATLEAQESNLSLAHREVLAQPSIQAGVSYGDPLQPFLLPTVGISIPLPLFSRSGGEIAMASADRDRAEAEVEVARRQSAAQVAQSRRELRMALARVDRDRQLLSLAQRVVAGSLTAFAEGATALPSVLEAQRSARDALGQYVDDLAAADMAAAAVRLFILSAPPR
jgi:outer membrane protein, heavy metal efflux system